jgi:hypothetical protein
MNKGTPVGIKFLEIPGRKNNCVKQFWIIGYFLDSRRTCWCHLLIDLDETGAAVETSPKIFGVTCTAKFLRYR